MGTSALITGITGQDGSYLAELLLHKGYRVHGLVRRTSAVDRDRLDGLSMLAAEAGGAVELHYGDLSDASSLQAVVSRTRPDQIYNLAAQSHVGVSFEQPEYTADVCGTGVLRLLEAMRSAGLDECRFYQASTSELFGNAVESPQSESTPFRPRSPYAVAKLYAYWLVRNYRDSYGLHASNGILFNHESPRRGPDFVTRKITLGLARLRRDASGATEPLRLGNLDACRDWGFAGDYVELMWRMLERDAPGDYVVATGEAHSVREFVEIAAAVCGFEVEWEGTGTEELGRDRRSGRALVAVDPRYYRPSEVDALVGDATKAERELGWEPRVRFAGLVEMMMAADLERIDGR